MLYNILFLMLGLYILVKGADFLVEGASSIAKKHKISPMVIGLTVVAFGTSLPELIVNVVAAINGNSNLAMGNVIGSNISNILLVLGAAALIANVKVKKSVLYKEIPFSFFSVLLLYIMLNGDFIKGNDVLLTRTFGLIMLSYFMFFMIYLFQTAKQKEVEEVEDVEKIKTSLSLNYIFLGIIGLFFGGRWIVDNAVIMAESLNISTFAISATVIAVGTSLPELVTSIAAARKKKLDLAVGNIVGSNIFNILLILGTTSVIKPILVQSFVNLDLIVLLMVTAIFFFTVFFNKNQEINRKSGFLYLLIYIAYIAFILARN